MCLAPGVTIDSAEAGLDAINRRLDDPSVSLRMDKGRRVTLLSVGTSIPIPRKLKPALIGFFVALMGLVITLACMNLANMLIARGANRRKELAIRLAVGASRFRLVRQMMSEGIVLSLLGGIAGFPLAYGLGVLNAHFTPPMTVPMMVGANPASSNSSTTVDVAIIPFDFVFANGFVLSGTSKVGNVLGSPNFQDATYTSGTTQ
jgi:putative ABC transport system permease protein